MLFYGSRIAFKVWITWSRRTVVKNLAHFMTLQSSWVSKNQLVMWSHKSILPALRFWPNAQASDLLAATGCSLSVTTSESNENNNGSVSNSSLKEQQRRRTAGFSRWGKGVFALLSTGFCRKKSDLPTGLMLSCCGSDLVEVSRWQTLMRRLFVQSTASF